MLARTVTVAAAPCVLPPLRVNVVISLGATTSPAQARAVISAGVESTVASRPVSLAT